MDALHTQRLILRPWTDADFEPFAALNADPCVMEFFSSTRTREESNVFAARIQAKIAERGWGFWAVSAPGISEFIGCIGLNDLDESSRFPFAPAVEIGWRLARRFWGKGFATEGALAALKFGFSTLCLPEIVSFTAVHNVRSQQVMQRIGMHRDLQGDFDHPELPEGHALRRQVLYRLEALGDYS